LSGGGDWVVFNGMGLGLIVMALLVLALAYAIVMIVRAALGRAAPEAPTWTVYLLPILCLVGVGVAAYLTFVETRQVAAICGPVGDCNTVQSSPYAKLFGVLPVGLLGVLGYLGILCAWAVWKLGKGGLHDLGGLAVFVLALFGVLFSIYLTYLELVVIRAVCMWCLGSAVIMAALLALACGYAVNWMAPMQEAEA
jgi:uncharacterized membrane protein